jgi:hypothetical protein
LIWGGATLQRAESQPLPKKFNHEIPNERSDHSNAKINFAKDIVDRPSQTSSARHTRVREFPHQKIGVKKKNDKTDFG